MSRLLLILLLINVRASNLIAQQYSFKATTPAVIKTMNKLVENAEKYIISIVSDSVYQQHFTLQTDLSEASSNFSRGDYLAYFNDSIDFIPREYELRYLITIEGDTLTDHFIVPADSLGNIQIANPEYPHILADLKAYKRLFSGQLKFNYFDVKQFIKAKQLKKYFILLRNSIELIHIKEYSLIKLHKYYWFVYRIFNGYEIVYRIDPDTGKFTKIIRKPSEERHSDQ